MKVYGNTRHPELRDLGLGSAMPFIIHVTLSNELPPEPEFPPAKIGMTILESFPRISKEKRRSLPSVKENCRCSQRAKRQQGLPVRAVPVLASTMLTTPGEDSPIKGNRKCANTERQAVTEVTQCHNATLQRDDDPIPSCACTLGSGHLQLLGFSISILRQI